MKSESSWGKLDMKFKNVCRVINGRAYKLDELLEKGKYPVLRVGNFFTNSEMLYSDLELESDKYCEDDDLLFAWSASFGPKIYRGPKSIYHYHIWKLQVDDSKADKYYLYYWLLNNVRRMQAGGHGSVMAHITKQDMENQEIDLPPLQLQKRIAGILKSLDEKMDNNAQINKNLLEQAISIFNWFYDSSTHQQPFSSVINVFGGGTPKTSDPNFWNGDIPFFTPKDVGNPYTFKTEKYITDDGLAKCNSRLYPTNTTFVTARGTVGKVSLAGVPMAMNQSCYALVSDTLDPILVYFYTLKVVSSLKHKASGAVFDAIVTRDFDNEMINILSDTDAQQLLEVVTPMFAAIHNNDAECLRLSALRDAILPKLLSGELAFEAN